MLAVLLKLFFVGLPMGASKIMAPTGASKVVDGSSDLNPHDTPFEAHKTPGYFGFNVRPMGESEETNTNTNTDPNNRRSRAGRGPRRYREPEDDNQSKSEFVYKNIENEDMCRMAFNQLQGKSGYMKFKLKDVASDNNDNPQNAGYLKYCYKEIKYRRFSDRHSYSVVWGEISSAKLGKDEKVSYGFTKTIRRQIIKEQKDADPDAKNTFNGFAGTINGFANNVGPGLRWIPGVGHVYDYVRDGVSGKSENFSVGDIVDVKIYDPKTRMYVWDRENNGLVTYLVQGNGVEAEILEFDVTRRHGDCYRVRFSNSGREHWVKPRQMRKGN